MNESKGDLNDLQQRWDEGASRDPMYVILSVPEMKGGLWNEEAFFESGRSEIATVMEDASRLGYPSQRKRALDFGCGLGRASQALTGYFECVDGVDVSSVMIERAQQLNRVPKRCFYLHNPAADLRAFESDSIDFIYSNMVLQHLVPALSRGYVREFVRVLAREGLLMFQLPSTRTETDLIQGGVDPLPPSGFSVSISVEPESIVGSPREVFQARVTSTNLSDQLWTAQQDPGTNSRQIKVGNHWLHADGSLFLLDDQRVGLPHDVAPGQMFEVTIGLTLPSSAGQYLVEFDMVQENVAWFADRGNDAARCKVIVEGEATEDAPTIWQPGCLDMHGVPQAIVLEELEAAGARVLEVTGDDFAGPDWVSFRYAVTK